MHSPMALQRVDDSSISNGVHYAATRHLTRLNYALANSRCFDNQGTSKEELVRHLMTQITTILQTAIVEYWQYDWTLDIATPSIILNDGVFADVKTVHPVPRGLPLPNSLVDANCRPRRRIRSYVSTFEEQSDITPQLFEYYRGRVNCNGFIHFPFVKNNSVAAGIVVIVDRIPPVGDPRIELAHALVNRLVAVLEVLDVNSNQATAFSNDDAKSFFLDALEQSPLSRREYIEKVCGADRALLESVKLLLSAHEEHTGSVLDLDFGRLLVDEVTSFRSDEHCQTATEEMSIAGKFQLKEQLGRGGSSVVYQGLQTAPFKRKVAVKIMCNEAESKEAKRKCLMAQFRAECETLGMMSHPNIVTVIEAGSIGGQPFLVMELVDGIPITKYCAKQMLSLNAKLELFIQLCRAVQHVHQKGVVHRDLKPSNVLVTVIDDKPLVKLIDFGIATSLINDPIKYEDCDIRNLVGTLAYMSPEQLEPAGRNIDCRSDVFGLGILLYRLLTGKNPFSADKKNKSESFDEFLRCRRTDYLVAPSQCVQDNVDEALFQSDRQNFDSAELAPVRRGDLDPVVMKCLRKDPSERYKTVGALIADIEAFTNQ